MKSSIKYLVPVSFLFLAVFSCRKKDNLGTPSSMIQGKWKLIKLGTDDNKNGVVESFEIKPVATSQQIVRTYKGDGTGTETNSNEPNLLFNWNIYGADSLRMNYKANDTVTYLISNMTSSDMTLVEYTQPTIIWLYFVKS